MAKLAEKAFQEKQFEDIAYFEPFYLKDFIATIPRKNILPSI
jgi:tRNA threonylcarbamoyladenosine biosynthesis protein TsaB